MEDRVYDFWAASCQDGYIGKLIDIVERAGGARDFYNMSPENMKSKLGFTDRMVKHIMLAKQGVNIERKYEKMIEKGISYVNYTDKEYPDKLREIQSRPYGLFVKGKLPDKKTKTVAVIGSRQCSEYGRFMADSLGGQLARAGVNVISGMAWGIDGIAQMAALNAGGKSYAVLGCGVDVVYPKNNQILYNRLCQDGNGLLSEYEPGSPAQSRRFPPRNRIISGLSDLVIVVEARKKSGTLITVDMAIDQGKSIMVVPGRVTDPLSIGCLNLIKEGAIPVTCVEDVISELLPESDFTFGDCGTDGLDADLVKKHGLTNEEISILKLIDFEPVSAEMLALKSSVDVEKVLKILTNLELAGVIREVSNFSFTRNVFP